MTNNNRTTQFTESPASWNTKYLDPSGFECQLTLRAENSQDLLEKVTNAISFLLANACTPAIYFRNGIYKSDSKSTEKKISSVTNGENNISKQATSEAWCPLHEIEMRKWSKNGKIWYSHKTVDGSWCSGKVKKQI